MKIYTKTGDDGNTNLFGGGPNARVAKSDARIDCYGNIDELNSTIGWAAVIATPAMADPLRSVQSDLFTIGSHLAVADGAALPASLPTLEDSIVARLEMQIDAAVAQLPPLRNFILPGGSELAGRLHIARTVCRRAERRLVRFAQDRPVSATILTFLNRLSDWLFVQARLANHDNGVMDVPWSGKS
ncbi:MAG: cob(I)alamin adenosyltransferase [Phycisphaerales bacterium]|jgi:cob(I)alamin adenosyltransferase|nr:cob(I)alamin adenosyltransferase [Phycisphaerales bacterium]MEA2734015.1 cob(I)alamin adenosyltransferase [Humisphaera sp.]